MNKNELVAKIAEKQGCSQKLASEFVTNFVDVVRDELKNDGYVQLIGFGSFIVRERKEHTGRNPQTGEEMEIAASKTPAFVPGKSFKDYIKK